ncbi:hypothetical protein D3C76_1675670 [compost metagenome]
MAPFPTAISATIAMPGKAAVAVVPSVTPTFAMPAMQKPVGAAVAPFLTVINAIIAMPSKARAVAGVSETVTCATSAMR